MPLSALRPQVTARFHEVDTYLSGIAGRESDDPRTPDSIDVRIMRGLFFVHLYGAFEYTMDQSFIRVAQHITGQPVPSRHIEKVIFSVAMENTFRSLRDLSDWQKKFLKRIELIQDMEKMDAAKIPDNVLSEGMQSVNTAVISLAFQVYGLKEQPFVDLSVRGYIEEVVAKRHAVAHGRESPAAVGVTRTSDLRIRYDALYRESVYIMETLGDFVAAKRFVASRHRPKYAR
jgi:RiboL-PSP-HEPN